MSNSRYLFVGMIVLTVFVIMLRGFDWKSPEDEIFFSQFLSQVENGEIKQVVIEGDNISGEYTNQGKFKTKAPLDSVLSIQGDNLVTQLLERGVIVEVKEDMGNPWYLILLINWGPFIVLIGIWVYLFKRNSSTNSGNKLFSIGKSRARMASEHDRQITFKDVAGIEESKQELEEIVDFLKNPDDFNKLGGRIPKGVLMVGAPGTGKTMLAKAVAGEAKVPFFSISGSDFVEMFVGVGASRVRSLFEESLKNAPCIVFIDEIDAVGRHRGAGLGGGHDEREQTLNQLLVEMDGFDARKGVIVIAATNRLDILDPALLRPGRFDRRIEVPLPDLKGREAILISHCKKIKLDPKVDLLVIAKGTPGFSGAEIANLVNEAALYAARTDCTKVSADSFEWARDKLTMGLERKSFKMDEKEKHITAYHEAGHAVVSAFVEKSDPVHKITIIPRGMALGVTAFLPEGDKLSMDKVELLSKITVYMGGRVAEEIFCDDITGGAENDFKNSTNLAYKMVCDWGMSNELGALTIKSREGSFLAVDYFQNDMIADETQWTVDKEVSDILFSCYERAKKILSQNTEKVEALVKGLLEKETINRDEFLAIIGDHKAIIS
ncbi:MAG: ATP-dependent zinc metalloprotease FtsH [SAR324 cluster bacterium]|nr:ATP-dependent zinc metalloprotease FtsH [SAR324 cluster bacterium]